MNSFFNDYKTDVLNMFACPDPQLITQDFLISIIPVSDSIKLQRTQSTNRAARSYREEFRVSRVIDQHPQLRAPAVVSNLGI